MSSEEKEIMADMFYLLRDHDDPPAVGTEACLSFWEKTAQDISALVGAKWNNHPLAVNIGVAILRYINTKGQTQVVRTVDLQKH